MSACKRYKSNAYKNCKYFHKGSFGGMIKICFAYESKKKLSYSKFGFYVVRLIALCIDFFEPGTFGAIELRCVADIRTTLGVVFICNRPRRSGGEE